MFREAVEELKGQIDFDKQHKIRCWHREYSFDQIHAVNVMLDRLVDEIDRLAEIETVAEKRKSDLFTANKDNERLLADIASAHANNQRLEHQLHTLHTENVQLKQLQLVMTPPALKP